MIEKIHFIENYMSTLVLNQILYLIQEKMKYLEKLKISTEYFQNLINYENEKKI